MGMSRRSFACRGHEAPNLFYILAMFRLVFRIRVDMLNFLVKRPWGQNVSLLQNLEVIYTFSIINKYDMYLETHHLISLI